MGTLYVVSTPLGNLDDISIRALKILLETPVIACEDTRHTGQFLRIMADRYKDFIKPGPAGDIKKQYISVRDWNENEIKEEVIKYLEQEDVALVSDAGTPLLSDPGFKLVRETIEKGYTVVPIPGAFAGAAALAGAGLPTNKFTFLGFWKDKYDIETVTTTVFYEAPDRLIKTCETIAAKYPAARVCVALEMTKIHERFIRGNAVEVLDIVKKENIKGEATVLVYRPESDEV